jgi:hypothetical protein
MAKSGLTVNLGQTKVLSYESSTGHFAIQRRMPLSPNIISGRAPTAVLRADVNLSNFLLVTKMTRDDHAIVGESRHALLANYEGLTVVGVGPHSNSRRSDRRHAAETIIATAADVSRRGSFDCWRFLLGLTVFAAPSSGSRHWL